MKKLQALLFILLLLQTSLFAQAQEKPKCFKKFTFSFLDFGFLYNKQKDIGIEKDILEEIKKRTHCEFEIITMTRARTWMSLSNGELDMTPTAITTPEREQFAYFIFYLKAKNETILRKELKSNSMADFMANEKLRFGVVRSVKHGSPTLDDIFLKKLHAQGRVDEFIDQQKLYADLRDNKVQGIFAPVTSYKKFLQESKSLRENVQIVDWIPDEKSHKSGFAMSRKTFSSEELKKWEKIVNPSFQKIIYKNKKYFSPPTT